MVSNTVNGVSVPNPDKYNTIINTANISTAVLSNIQEIGNWHSTTPEPDPDNPG
mgnify:CR=1 FL=1